MVMLDALTFGYIQLPMVQASMGLVILAVIAWLMNWIAKTIVLRLMIKLLQRLPFDMSGPQLASLIGRLSNIVPTLVVQIGIGAVPHLPVWLVGFVHSLCAAFIILTFAITISAGLSLLNDLYQRRPDAGSKPIKGYVQVVKILVYGAAAILILAALMDQSPLLLLSGLGAMAAVLMLVFKDTILSLVASVQIGSNDMVRVGDWIEMPQLNANGDVIDIALHTVKIQNFDKTITTIPTHRLITESFRNWRGMQESGGRRIMRSLMLDQNSVHFLGEDELTRLACFSLLRDYFADKCDEVTRWNAQNAVMLAVDARRLTNVGTFRAYVLAYLKSRPDIADDKTLLVRQLAPSEHGLPLEIYAFANTIVWAQYEGIQADVFDHLIAILPEFGLRLFQRPTGADLRGL